MKRQKKVASCRLPSFSLTGQEESFADGHPPMKCRDISGYKFRRDIARLLASKANDLSEKTGVGNCTADFRRGALGMLEAQQPSGWLAQSSALGISRLSKTASTSGFTAQYASHRCCCSIPHTLSPPHSVCRTVSVQRAVRRGGRSRRRRIPLPPRLRAKLKTPMLSSTINVEQHGRRTLRFSASRRRAKYPACWWRLHSRGCSASTMRRILAFDVAGSGRLCRVTVCVTALQRNANGERSAGITLLCRRADLKRFQQKDIQKCFVHIDITRWSPKGNNGKPPLSV